VRRGRKTTTLAIQQVGWVIERRTKIMIRRFTQIRQLVFLPAIFALLILSGCGVDDNIVGPEATTHDAYTTPGAYTSVEEVMSIIKTYGDNTPGEAQSSGILMAPGRDKEKEEKEKIKKKYGGEIKLKIRGSGTRLSSK